MQDDIYKRAIQREKKARSVAEKLLEDKTRELYILNQEIHHKNEVLNRANNALKAANDLVNFSQQKDISLYSMFNKYLSLICDYTPWSLGFVFILEGNQQYHTHQDLFYHVKEAHETLYTEAFGVFQSGSLHHNIAEVVLTQKKAAQIDDFLDLCQNIDFSENVAVALGCAYVVPLFKGNSIFAIATFPFNQDEAIDKSHYHFAVDIANGLNLILQGYFFKQDLKLKNKELSDTLTELKQAQSQLLQSSRMASIGQLAAGIAHEINNPVAYVINNISVLKKYMESITQVIEGLELSIEKQDTDIARHQKQLLQKNNIDYILEDTQNLVEESTEGLNRVSDIVKGLKEFSHVDEAQHQSVDLNDCINSTLNILPQDLQCHADIFCDLSPLPKFACNPGKINQVLMNLFVNALQAVANHPARGKIWISSKLNLETIELTVKDNGCGIERQHLDKLFDPFFTTKPVGEGTGLGLSISYGIIQEHEGTLNVHSQLGEGTVFTITFPNRGQQLGCEAS